MDDYNYQGFPLRNYAGSNKYQSVTVDECQYLCEKSDLCRYFNYIIKNGENVNACYLKFGVGFKANFKNNGAFGHKYSSGKQISQTNLVKTVSFKLTAHLEKNGQPGERVNHQMVLVATGPEGDIKQNVFQPEMEGPAIKRQIWGHAPRSALLLPQ